MFDSGHAVVFDELDDELCRSGEPTRRLLAKFVFEACHRVSVLAGSGKTDRFARLIESGAWIDAAFALIELEMPFWSMRRLTCDGGEWVCALSRRPWLPTALDDTAEATHKSMPLAILRAALRARRMAVLASEARSAVPEVRPEATELVCCDNFA
jgi:hypothetical protein